MDKWFAWLGDELRSWSQAPMLVRYVMLIIQNQRAKVCYEFEEALLVELYDRFSDVPWSAGRLQLREVIGQNLNKPPSLYEAAS